MEKLITEIKSDFRTNIDNLRGKLSKARGAIDKITVEINMRKQWGDPASKKLVKDLGKAVSKFRKLKQQRDDIERT